VLPQHDRKDLRRVARRVTVHNQECLFRNGHMFWMELRIGVALYK
jgi:hypothetical protein